MVVLSVCAKHGRIGCECGRKDSRPSAGRRGYGIKWQRIRRRHLERQPFCVECGALATDVDHIDGDSRNNEPTNLRSFCHSHHSQRTARDQPGGWAA